MIVGRADISQVDFVSSRVHIHTVGGLVLFLYEIVDHGLWWRLMIAFSKKFINIGFMNIGYIVIGKLTNLVIIENHA